MKIVSSLMLFISISYAYGNAYDVASRYQDALAAYKIEQNKAKVILEEVMGEVSVDHPLFQDIYKSYLEYSGLSSDESFDKAIKFATGRKEETYCKGVGLVFLKGFHNDGTVSRLFLGDGNRSMLTDSYSVMNKGQWKYQLSNKHRKPVWSEVWINSSSENSFDIEEVRNTPSGRDQGQWKSNWEKGSTTNSFSTTGNSKEPIPMYMAVDYHSWGTPDLGYKIKFKIGDTQKLNFHESTYNHGKILLSSHRTVVKKLNTYKTNDFDNSVKRYKDCFLVETKIKFAGIEKK